MFKREINPFPVSDVVTFRNVDKSITLTVRSNPAALVVGLKNSQEKMTGLNDKAELSERIAAARLFADTIFGSEQGEKLLQFYNNEPLTVINACGMYFQTRLAKLITKAQKKK